MAALAEVGGLKAPLLAVPREGRSLEPDELPRTNGDNQGAGTSMGRRPAGRSAWLRPCESWCKTSRENPICCAGGFLLSTSRHYKTKPTHGIGRYKHLIAAQELKKKRGKVEVRPINLGTDYEYGVLNIQVTAYDMALAESYAKYVHNLCNDLSIKVEESYALPTKTMEVLQLQDQGNKMFLDSILTIHERVVQISGLSATFAEIFLEIIRNSLPEGVRLSVKEHTEDDFKGRFKARPELEELLAKLN
ncbi:39S ribosomal protein L48, mitochondrial [Orycteropus afer afer]|uniref:Large ribosomal subunit protein mL48 n=1 Tax=Orycteropus afer afer TaxID=1230840 RepID=A0A8B6ZVS9_ORYAF|nr:39S ribosomal protein L48, mitochondrial [Orycteropus afer afer]